MIKHQASCDGCKAAINGNGGYSLEIIRGPRAAEIRISTEILFGDYSQAKHFCGQACLIRKLGCIVDGMSGDKIETEVQDHVDVVRD